MEFRELSDEEWELIKPLLPPKTGRPRVDDRRVINGILYVLVTGPAITCFATLIKLPYIRP
jgi:transposase